MTKPKLDRFIERLHSEWPQFVVAALPFTSEDDPAIRHFIHVLCVPVAELSGVSRRAWTLAFDFYGDDPIPFHLTTVDPETSEKYFPEALNRARAYRPCEVAPRKARSFARAQIRIGAHAQPDDGLWADLLKAFTRAGALHLASVALDENVAGWIVTDLARMQGATIESGPGRASAAHTDAAQIAVHPDAGHALAA